MKIEIKNKIGKVYYTASYDSVNNWNYCNWTGNVSVEEVINACQKALELMKSYPSPNLLNDNQQISGPWSGANDWITNTWMPQALGLGLKRFAYVVSPNIFSSMTAQQLVTRVENLNFEIQIFYDKPSAEAWLKSK